mgnify:FL=1
MKITTTRRFDTEYASLASTLKKMIDRKLRLFQENSRHPSLHTKKMEGHNNIWEGRITKKSRFTFHIQEDYCILRSIGTHDILKTP